MGDISLLWTFVLSGAAAVLGAALAVKVLPIDQHLLFFIVYAQAFLYLFAAPTLFAYRSLAEDGELLNLYAAIQFGALLLFLVPSVVTYYSATQKIEKHANLDADRFLKLRAGRQWLLIAVAIAFAIAYVIVLVRNDLLFRRIGHESLARAFVELSRLDFLIIRVFDRLAIPLILLLLIVAGRSQARLRKHATRVALALTAVAYFFVASINSRLAIVQGLALVLVTAVYWGKSRGFSNWKFVARVGIAAAAAAYLLTVTARVREEVAAAGSTGIRLQMFVPFRVDRTDEGVQGGAGGDLPIGEALHERVNCVDLMARMTPAALEDGFPWGAAWWPPMIVTVGQLVAPELANEYKLAVATTAKTFLIRDYTSIGLPDYPSCVVTDAYGNFGPLGMVLAGIAVGGLTAWATRWSRPPTSGWMLAVGLVLVQVITHFESELFAVLTFWIPHGPALLLLALLNPVTARKEGKVARARARDRREGT